MGINDSEYLIFNTYLDKILFKTIESFKFEWKDYNVIPVNHDWLAIINDEFIYHFQQGNTFYVNYFLYTFLEGKSNIMAVKLDRKNKILDFTKMIEL